MASQKGVCPPITRLVFLLQGVVKLEKLISSGIFLRAWLLGYVLFRRLEAQYTMGLPSLASPCAFPTKQPHHGRHPKSPTISWSLELCDAFGPARVAASLLLEPSAQRLQVFSGLLGAFCVGSKGLQFYGTAAQHHPPFPATFTRSSCNLCDVNCVLTKYIYIYVYIYIYIFIPYL